MTKKEGLVFFDMSHMNLVLKKIGWDEKTLREKKCIVCGCQLTKNNIGALTRESPIQGVCRKFSCVMSVLLAHKKESLR